MTIGDRIKQLRVDKGMTQEELGAKIGVKKQAIYKYEQGLVVNLKRDVIENLSKALEVSPSYLMGFKNDTETLPKNIIPIPKSHLIPVIGTIACGNPILAKENIEDYEPCPDYVSADFALHCKGDSMINARINDGDTVFIRKQPEVENGEIAVVEIFDGEGCDECCEATLKRFYHEGNKVMLSPENPKYHPLIFVGDEINSIKVIGKAVYFLSTIK